MRCVQPPFETIRPENTTQPSLDPLTLVVSLDAAGHAEGWLYDDDGDGFGYQKVDLR